MAKPDIDLLAIMVTAVLLCHFLKLGFFYGSVFFLDWIFFGVKTSFVSGNLSACDVCDHCWRQWSDIAIIIPSWDNSCIKLQKLPSNSKTRRRLVEWPYNMSLVGSNVSSLLCHFILWVLKPLSLKDLSAYVNNSHKYLFQLVFSLLTNHI